MNSTTRLPEVFSCPAAGPISESGYVSYFSHTTQPKNISRSAQIEIVIAPIVADISHIDPAMLPYRQTFTSRPIGCALPLQP